MCAAVLFYYVWVCVWVSWVCVSRLSDNLGIIFIFFFLNLSLPVCMCVCVWDCVYLSLTSSCDRFLSMGIAHVDVMRACTRWDISFLFILLDFCCCCSVPHISCLRVNLLNKSFDELKFLFFFRLDIINARNTQTTTTTTTKITNRKWKWW